MKLQDKILDVYLNRGISLTENQKAYLILNEEEEQNRYEGELRIFEYFLGDFKEFLNSKGRMRESLGRDVPYGDLKEYLEGEDFTGYFGCSRFLEAFEDLGVSSEDLTTIWKEGGLPFRFKEYVQSILLDPKFDLKGRLSEGVIFEDEGEPSDQDARDVKEDLVKKALVEDDPEGIDLEGVSDEDLDDLLAKLVKVEEKALVLLERGGDLDEDLLVEKLSKSSGMHLDESKEVLDYYRDLNKKGE